MFAGDKQSSLYARKVSNKEKSYIALTAVVNIVKPFSSLLTKRPNKLKSYPGEAFKAKSNVCHI